MPPCYTFNRVCLPATAQGPCSSAVLCGSCDVQNWFWILAAAVGVGLVVAHGGGR